MAHTAMARWASFAVVGVSLTACGSVTDLYRGDEIHVAARTTVLEQDVEVVSKDYRELINRYEALERLYIDLAARRDEQDSALRRLEAQIADAARSQELRSTLSAVESNVSDLQEQFRGLEDRLFSVEAVSSTTNAGFPEASTPENAVLNGTPGGATVPTAPMSIPVQGSVPVGDSPPAATNASTTEAESADAAPETPRFGVHIASYRSDDQVAGGWTSLQQRLDQAISDLEPLIFSQNQPGIGRFLRLIVGPVESEQEAEALCNDIRGIDAEQYCRVTDYQGDQIPGN